MPDDRGGLYFVGTAVLLPATVIIGIFAIVGFAILPFFRGEKQSQVRGTAEGNLIYPAGVTPEEVAGPLNDWIKRTVPSSPLATEGITFAKAGQQYNLNPALMVAIAAQESSLGTAGSGPPVHNPFGWNCPPCMNFSSWSDAIILVTSKMKQNYLDEGYTTIAQIGGKWAPVGAANDPQNLNSEWVTGVTKFFDQIVQAVPQLTPPTTGGGTVNGCMDVPQINQYQTMWCGRASQQMVVNYFNRSIGTDPKWQSGHGLSADTVKSLSGKSYTCGGKISSTTDIDASLSKGYPVIYYSHGIFNGPHIFVLTGFNSSTNVYCANDTMGGRTNVFAINGISLSAQNLIKYNSPQEAGCGIIYGK